MKEYGVFPRTRVSTIWVYLCSELAMYIRRVRVRLRSKPRWNRFAEMVIWISVSDMILLCATVELLLMRL